MKFFRKPKLDENRPAEEVGKHLSLDRLSYYTGSTRDILLAAITKLRIYLWTKDPYPKARVLSTLSFDCFTHACEAVLGKKSKSTSENIQLCVLTQSCSTEANPQYTAGMRRLVSRPLITY